MGRAKFLAQSYINSDDEFEPNDLSWMKINELAKIELAGLL